MIILTFLISMTTILLMGISMVLLIRQNIKTDKAVLTVMYAHRKQNAKADKAIEAVMLDRKVTDLKNDVALARVAKEIKRNTASQLHRHNRKTT